jgi:reverse gyrase
MEVGTGIVGYAFQKIVILKKEVQMNKECIECGIQIRMTRYEKGKLCMRCKSERQAGNTELRQMFKELKNRNSKMTPKELGMDEKFEDDPRAVKEIEYGRVIRIPTTLERNDHV